MIKQTNVAKWVLQIIYFDFSLDIYYSIYHILIMEEMTRRGYRVSPEWLDKNYRGKICPVYEDLAEEQVSNPIYSEHDSTYYEECLANLREKGIEL